MDANLSSLPKDPGNPSPMSDVASLVELMKTQVKAAEEREMRMASMLESALKPSADGRSQPVQVTSSPPSTRAVSAERPMLLSSATLQISCPGRRHGQTTPNASIWQTKTGRRESARSVSRSTRTFDGTSVKGSSEFRPTLMSLT